MVPSFPAPLRAAGLPWRRRRAAGSYLIGPLTPSVGTRVERRAKPLATSCFHSALRSIQFAFTLRAWMQLDESGTLRAHLSLPSQPLFRAHQAPGSRLAAVSDTRQRSSSSLPFYTSLHSTLFSPLPPFLPSRGPGSGLVNKLEKHYGHMNRPEKQQPQGQTLTLRKCRHSSGPQLAASVLVATLACAGRMGWSLF